MSWWKACEIDDIDFVRRNFNYFVGSVDPNGQTGLMLAARNNSLRVAKMLLERQGKLQDYHGRTALMVAAECNHLGMIRLFLPVEIGMKDNYNNMALDYCCSDEAKYLLRHERFNYDEMSNFLSHVQTVMQRINLKCQDRPGYLITGQRLEDFEKTQYWNVLLQLHDLESKVELLKLKKQKQTQALQQKAEEAQRIA